MPIDQSMMATCKRTFILSPPPQSWIGFCAIFAQLFPRQSSQSGFLVRWSYVVVSKAVIGKPDVRTGSIWVGVCWASTCCSATAIKCRLPILFSYIWPSLAIPPAWLTRVLNADDWLLAKLDSNTQLPDISSSSIATTCCAIQWSRWADETGIGQCLHITSSDSTDLTNH